MVAHELPVWLDVGAMAVAAAFGARVARMHRIALFGVLLAGATAGLGGGMARDVLLGLEPVAITNWYYTLPSSLPPSSGERSHGACPSVGGHSWLRRRSRLGS